MLKSIELVEEMAGRVEKPCLVGNDGNLIDQACVRPRETWLVRHMLSRSMPDVDNHVHRLLKCDLPRIGPFDRHGVEYVIYAGEVLVCPGIHIRVCARADAIE